MTLAQATAMVTAEARARAWWWQHRRRRQQRTIGHNPVVVVDSSGKDIIATATIERRCSRQ